MKQPTKTVLLNQAKKFMAQRLDIPEGTSGDISVKYKQYAAGKTLPVVSMRIAIFTGQPVTDLVLQEPTIVRELQSKEDGVWMSDQPCELVQMWNELGKHAKGNVLVGGLGLGVLPRMLTKTAVKSVTVVEKSQDVINLVGTYLNHGTKIVHDDLFEYVKGIQKGQYDTALLDIWQGTGEWVWQTQVVPLRRAIGQKISKVYCWQEETMLGQVWQGLFRAVSVPIEINASKSRCHYYAFTKAVEEAGCFEVARLTKDQLENDFKAMVEVEQKNQANIGLKIMAQNFLTRIGTPYWEKTFGKYWDEFLPGKDD